MTTQPDPTNNWSRAVQIELDGLKQGVENRLNDLASRVSSFVSNAEYNADKRSTEIQVTNLKDKIHDVETDATTLKSDVIKLIDELKLDNAAAHVRLEQAVNAEVLARQQERKDEMAARQNQFRWLLSAVLIPIVLAVMDLMLNKK